MKRLFSFALILCMLLATLPFSVFAEEAPTTVVYDFTGIAASDDEPVNIVNNSEVGTNWKYYYCPAKGTLLGYTGYAEYATTIEDWYYQEIIDGNGMNKYWFAFKLSGLEAGMYDITFNMNAVDAAASFNANVYMIPATGAPTNNSGITNKIRNGDILGSIKSCEEASTVKRVNVGGDESNEYIIMIDGVLNDAGHLKDTKIQIKNITFTKLQNVKPTTPTTAPTIPDFNTPEEPVDDAGSNFPVVPVAIGAALIAVVAVVVVVAGKKKKNSAE